MFFHSHRWVTAPASITLQECDCKWIQWPMGGLVIRIDIPRDTVSLDCYIKSTHGHTSIHMTLWNLQLQYKMWHSEWYPPRDHTWHQIEAFYATEHCARAIVCLRRISLQCTTRASWVCPIRSTSLMQENPSMYRCYYNQENTFQVAERPSRRQMLPRRPHEQGRSASAPNLHTGSPREEASHSCDSPIYEEAMQSLGRAPTQQDLGPFSPVSLSSLLVSYEDDSPSTPEEEEQ